MRGLWRVALVVGLSVSAVVLPTTAHAKGVVDVTVRIEWEGKGRTLRLDRDDHAVELAMATQFYAGARGTWLGPVEFAAPTGERLGPRYVAVFRTHRSR